MIKTHIPARPRNKKIVPTGGASISPSISSAVGSSHTHNNKSLLDLINQGNIDVLSKLFVDESDNLYTTQNFYSQQEVSAYGIGSGGSGGGGDISKLPSWAGYTPAMVDYYVSAGLLVPFYNDMQARVSDLEDGATPTQHFHIISDITGLQSALDGKVDDSQVLTNVPAGAKFTDTIYTHPSHTARASGMYKITVDSLGHVTGATAVVKADITLLGIPAQDTTYGLATTSANGLMSATDKVKLNGIATGATANTGTVTSVGLSVPTGLSVSGTPITTSGTLAVTFASGYSIPTTAKQTNWDSAYTHSQATGNPHGTTFAQINSKPTTISGYDITDAVTTNTAQNITGAKTFSANVGIGTTSPEAALHIKGSKAQSSAGFFQLVLEDSGSNYPGLLLKGTSGYHAAIRSDGGDGIEFLVGDNTALVGVMSIRENGNVGIGTGVTLPSQKLHVVGNILATGTVTTPKVIFSAAGWSLEQVGTELQMKYNGTAKMRFLSGGSIVAAQEITAYS